MSLVSKRSGFTLIELLVVVSIMVIAASILFVGGGSGGDGIRLSSAQRVVSSVAQGARGQALLKSSRVRLIIYSDNAANKQEEKKLRYFGIVYWGTDEWGDPGWIAATQGSNIPEGIYFNPDLSESLGGTSSWGRDSMRLDYPRIKVGNNVDPVNGGGSESYFYYEFNENGTMSSEFANTWLALQAGVLIPIDPNNPDSNPGLFVSFDKEDVGEEKVNLKSALIFRRVGSTTMVTDPEALSPN